MAIQRAKEALNEAIEAVKESKLSNPKQEKFIIETKKMIELTESESAKNSTLNQKLGNKEFNIPLIKQEESKRNIYFLISIQI